MPGFFRNAEFGALEVPVAQMAGQPFMLTVLESVEKAMTGNH